MPEKDMNQEFSLKKIDEIRNYLIEEINRNELMRKKHKKVCRVLNYIDHLLIVISKITECVSISDFASLVGIPIGIKSSAIRLKICAITAGIKKYKSINKKKKKTHDKMILLAKCKLNSIEVLIFKALIDSNISHDEFALMNNVLQEFYGMKEVVLLFEVQKNTQRKNPEVVRTKNGKIMLLPKCAVCNSKKSKFIKKQSKKLKDYLVIC